MGCSHPTILAGALEGVPAQGAGRASLISALGNLALRLPDFGKRATSMPQEGTVALLHRGP